MNAESSRKRKFFTIAETAELAGTECFPRERGTLPMPRSFKTDSRNVLPGDAFIAMPGERTDGHLFIADAAARGASVIILRSDWYEENKACADALDAVKIPVADSEKSVALLARHWLGAVSPKVVGITGSVGKTTTRELLYRAMRVGISAHSAIKSYNTLIGCAMTILSMPSGAEVLILELGANHPGEIGEIVRNFPVTHGIITDVTEAHLEGLNSIEGVLSAKMEICDSERLEFLSYNNDNDALSAAVKRAGLPARVIGVGFGDADVSVSDVSQSLGSDGVPHLSLSISSREESIHCEAEFFGRQHAKNIAFAYSVARDFGVAGEAFAKSVRQARTPRGRGRICGMPGGLIIDESYNASPSSMSCALENVLEMKLDENLRKIAILGGMRELGRESGRWHEVIMSRASLFDEIYLIGSEWDDLETKQSALMGKWKTVDSFIGDFDPKSASKAVILIKGSRFYGMERLLPILGAKLCE
ncbi:MAG: UDP-N-acetylmuramoyl-tripeptide--D-alanyl-D-alanine ligase [Synergistaceae bacterium]|jgi:UDP-N-acetylmuramoyl-tripeptide--D-alanyl-D-alanine ligase|nr:UDP-N-acetylmuramoyl-tripeptide--D-alanyl-D-alanine ligase [Synergistaceae bacterium]